MATIQLPTVVGPNALQKIGRPGPKPITYTPAQEAEVLKALRETEFSYVELAGLFDLPVHTVYNINNKHGVRAVRRHKQEVKPTVHLVVPVEEDDLKSRRDRLKAELEAVERQIQDSAIRVKAEGEDIVIYGMGMQQLRANWRQWLRFLKNNGAAQVRDQITQNFTEAKS